MQDDNIMQDDHPNIAAYYRSKDSLIVQFKQIFSWYIPNINICLE